MRLFLNLFFLLTALPLGVWADGDGGGLTPSIGLSMQFFCSASEVAEGNLGLLAGFLIAAWGMWKLIQGSLKSGIIWIVAGALVTALPSLVFSTLGGISTFLQQQKITSSDLVSYINYARGMKGHCDDLAAAIDWTDYNKMQEKSGGMSWQTQQQAIKNGALGSNPVNMDNVPQAAGGSGPAPGSCSQMVKGAIIPERGHFGKRIHPIKKIWKLHAGVDLAAPSGTPIKAPGSGRVISAGWAGTAGQRTIIDHGNGTTTVYMHQSSLAKRANDPVTAGDITGYVGTTGLSTGPHLHFEIRKNGTPVDPAASSCMP